MIDRRGDRAKPTLVFLHGATASRTMWAPQMAYLSESFDCIALDLPGHGERVAEPFTVETAGRAVIQTMDDAGVESAVLVGLSMGGYVALKVASTAPQRVAGLVLSGATASYRGWGGLSTKIYGMLVPLLGNSLREKSNESLRRMAPEQFVDEILSQPASFSGGGQALRNIPGRDYRRMASEFAGPILLLNGERDKVNRSEESDFLAHRPDTTVQVLADSGHACSLSQWQAFSEGVRQFAVDELSPNQ